MPAYRSSPTGRHQRSRSRSPAGESVPRRHQAASNGSAPEQPYAGVRVCRQGRTTGHGRRHHPPAPGERRPLRAPDPSLEPQDEALYLHRAQRHLHHRPAAVADLHRPRVRLRQGHRLPRRPDPVRRHQEAGPGGHLRAGHPGRDAVRQPALAGRHADQLPHRHQADPAAQGAGGHGLRGRGRLRPDQEGAARPAPGEGQAGEDPRRYPRHDPHARRRSGSSTPRRSTWPSTRRASCGSR